MKFQELLYLCHFEVFYYELIKHYGDMKEQPIELIKKGFDDMKTLDILSSEDPLEIQIYHVEEAGTVAYDVCATSDQDDYFHSLVFTDWKKLLGYELNPELFQWLMPEEVVAHLYWEMSWSGLTYEEAHEHHVKEEVEEAFRISMVSFIRALKDKEYIFREDLKTFISSYNDSNSEITRVAFETAIEDLIQARPLGEDVLNYLIESIDEDDFVAVIKERYRYES